MTRIDAGDPIVILSGLHAGCFELFGGERVRAIRDLKGKTVAVSGVGGPDHAFIASMLAYVGLDARKDVSWLALPTAESIERFANGKVDAFMGFPTVPQELRARSLGRVVVNSAAVWAYNTDLHDAWSLQTANSSASTRSPLSGRCGRS